MTDWKKFKHAYGSAENIPVLLEQLKEFPTEASDKEPWHSLWSSLYHQGDIYSASFAAVPELTTLLASNPARATFSFLALPASIEISREKAGIQVPDEILKNYFEAIHGLARLALDCLTCTNDSLIRRAAVAAVAVAAGQHAYAEMILEIPAEEVPEVLEWYWER